MVKYWQTQKTDGAKNCAVITHNTGLEKNSQQLLHPKDIIEGKSFKIKSGSHKNNCRKELISQNLKPEPQQCFSAALC